MKHLAFALPLLLLLAGRTSVALAQTSVPQTSIPYADVLARLDSARSDRPPPLSTGRKVAQVLIGGGVGIVSGVVGAAAGLGLSDCDDNDTYFCGFGGIALGFTAGYVFGSGLGAHAVGHDEEASGRLSLTLLGSTGGLLLAGLVLSGIDQDEGPLPAIIFFAGPPLGAMIANNLSRRYRTPPGESGLLNFDGDGFRFGVPAVSMTQLADPHRTVAQSVRLLTASW